MNRKIFMDLYDLLQQPVLFGISCLKPVENRMLLVVVIGDIEIRAGFRSFVDSYRELHRKGS
jgi:hypothetical protein